MKSYTVSPSVGWLSSLPVWGAWIEINELDSKADKVMSLPVWGAWIEIIFTTPLIMIILSLPVWGAWIEIPPYRNNPAHLTVAPCMGSVD